MTQRETALQQLRELVGRAGLTPGDMGRAQLLADDAGAVVTFERLDLTTWQRRRWVYPREGGDIRGGVAPSC